MFLRNKCPKFNLVNKCITRQKTSTSTNDNNNYQYLHRSKLPTDYFQKSLPRLPIPVLEKTCERYLTALEPILSPETYAQTKATVAIFSNGIGQDLQALLQKSDRINKHTSYISEPWFDMYLSDRSPLPLNYNPLLIMQHDSKPEYNNQLLRSANLVISSLRFMRSLQSNILEPEVFHMNPAKSDNLKFRLITGLAPRSLATYVAYLFKAFPLDMSQYKRLFGVTRIPQMNKDIIKQFEDSRHILVIRGGKFFAVDVLNANKDIEPPNVILGRLKLIIDQNPSGEIVEKSSLGVMTAANRNFWAATRQHLVKIGNTEQLEMIDSALFCLSLDGNDVKYNDENPQKLVKDFLSGNAENRWFDKSISLLVGGDGTAAVNFEHSWGDGVAVLRYFNEIYKETTNSPHVHPNTVASPSEKNSVRPICFKFDNRIEADIAEVKKKHEEILNSCNLNILRYKDGINKKSCKLNKVSPDSIMQLSFQLAYRSAFGNYVGTYESCSTAAFRHGRTETIRPCTLATKEFCEVMHQPADRKPNKDQLLNMLRKCSQVHGQLTKEAAMGQGFDRHLFGLRHMAQVNGIEIPKLYFDEAYKKINYNIISTSTLSSPAVLAGCFGPVVHDGLGVGYSIQDEECGALVTSYKGQRDGALFIKNLKNAFDQISDILKTKN